MLNRNFAYQSLVIAVGACTLAGSTGCRSMPGRNLFGFRGEPSAETIAGNGPTTTYPVPPSASATPEAIASVAGGTATPNKASTGVGPDTAQVAGVDISPGFVTPTSSIGRTNPAAAQANGIYGKPPATGGPVTSPAALSGYQFGSKNPNTKSNETNKPDVASATPPASSYARTSGFPEAGGELKVPSTSTSPPAASNYTKPTLPGAGMTGTAPASSTESADSGLASGSGFTLPTDGPAVADISPPASSVSTDSSGATAFVLPSATSDKKPDFSTASTSESVSAPSNKWSSGQEFKSEGGYSPGSTSGSAGYPTGQTAPSTSGSFYR